MRHRSTILTRTHIPLPAPLLFLLVAVVWARPACAYESAPPPAVAPLPAPKAADITSINPTPLTDLLSRAEATSPTLTAASQARRQAEARAVAAGALPPVILNVGHGFGTGASGTDEDIRLSGLLELGSKRGSRIDEARREVDAARAREAQALAELTFQLRTAVAGLQAAAAEERLVQENLELARMFQQRSELQFQAGDVPEAAVLRAQVEVENVEQSLVAAMAATAGQRAAVNVLIGAEPGAPLAAPEPSPPPARVLDVATLRQLALARPDMRAAEATMAARTAAVAIARAARQPDLTFDAVHARLNRPEGNVLRIGLAFPLFDYGLTRANVNAAQAAAEEQRANLELLRRQAAQEVETAYINWDAARRQAERLGEPQLARARRLRDLAELGYREGQFSYLELLDAQRAYLTTFSQYVRAVTAANTAEAALERAVGGSLPAGGR